MLTENEQRLLDYYRTPVGEKEWRTSDLAWVEYKKLEEKEKNGSNVCSTLRG